MSAKRSHPGLLAALIVLILLVSCTGTPSANQTPVASTLQLQPCQLAAPGIATRLPARCGTLTVLEDRADPTGPTLDLFVAVIPSISRTPQNDPLVFITGGPGGASTQDYIQVAAAFRRINEKRDILLIDQRGTGRSHPLQCSLEGIKDADVDQSDAVLQQWLTGCWDQLEVDPNQFTTQVAVEDLEAVRVALGYGRLNLYGISYGTRVAQSYLKRYPQNVRTVILDGVVPQAEPLGQTVASDAQRAMDLAFDRCAADPDCNAAFPDLPGTLTAVLDQLEQQPITVTVNHPTSGEPTPVRFTRESLASTLRLFNYAPETTAILPLLLHTAHETGDFSRLAALSLIISQEMEGSINRGMNYSVICAEDVPFLFDAQGRFQGEQAVEDTSYLGPYYSTLAKLCRDWPVKPVSADFKEPVRADVPTLLLSGEADPVTPPENAAEVAAALPRSLSLVAPGQGHGVIFRGCLPQLVTEFVNEGAFEQLDTTCVAKIEPLPFFLRFAGSNP